MSRMDGLRPTETPFDGFLYAKLGADRAGNAVSVLSALARLGFDPWAKAAELSTMTQDGARQHLRLLLARFHDIPDLGRDRDTVVKRLIAVLSHDLSGRSLQRAGLPASPVTGGSIPLVIALLVIVFLVQSILVGLGAAGD